VALQLSDSDTIIIATYYYTLKIWGAGVYSPRSYGAEFVFFAVCLSVTLLLGQLYTATSRVTIDHARHRKPRNWGERA